jgi:hypothetical protein
VRVSPVVVRYDPMPAFRYAHAKDGRPLHTTGHANCPLCACNGCYSWNEFARSVGFNGTAMAQWVKRGMNERTADRVATELALHPAMLWPEWWANLVKLEEAEAERVARRKRQEAEQAERRKAKARRPRLEAAVEAMFANGRGVSA